MEGKIQTSFIPKKPLIETGVHQSSSLGIFSIIGWFVFIIVLAASVGVFVYEQYVLAPSIVKKDAELKSIMDNFDSSSVNHFVQLDNRLTAAAKLLNNHLAFTALLDLLSKKTIETVQFTNLAYTNDGSKISLDLSGKAPDFASVALQSDTFSSQPYLKNQVFSGLVLDQNGSVLFKVNASVDPAAISYKKLLAVPAVSQQTDISTSTQNQSI